MSDYSTFNERQRKEAAHFDEFVKDRVFRMDQYSRPEFGPWNPYWFHFNLVKQAFRDPTQRVLSFGCGRGFNAVRFAKVGFDVFGFDVSARSIEIAEGIARDEGLEHRTHFSVQPGEQLNFPDGYFDIVAGENVLHHVEMEPAVREIHRVLKPGGMAVFKEPWATPWRDKIRRNPPVTWFMPVGMKNVKMSVAHHHTGQTVKLERRHVQLLERYFPTVTLHRFRLLAVLSAFTTSRTFLEKCDLALFTAVPFLRRFGDMVVLEFRKEGASQAHE